MITTKKRLTGLYANLTITTTNGYKLLDILSEWIVPALAQPKWERQARSTTYSFPRISFEDVSVNDEPNPCLVGTILKQKKLEINRFIRNESELGGEIMLEREDVLEEVSVFSVRLADHRLIGVALTPEGPKTEAIANTIRKALNDYRNLAMKNVLAEFRKEGHSPTALAHPIMFEAVLEQMQNEPGFRLTQKALQELTSFATVSAKPIGTNQSFGDFVNRFELLTTVELKLQALNNEKEVSEAVSAVQKVRERWKAAEATVDASSEAGLDKAAVIADLSPSVQRGTVSARLVGKGKDGEDLSGSADMYQAKSTLKGVAAGDDADQIVLAGEREYRRLEQNGTLPAKPLERPIEEIRELTELAKRTLDRIGK